MHGPVLHQGQPVKGWIWLFAGTAEGPVLAETLLQRGWNVRVSVVTPGAARAYRQRRGLEVRVGACSSDQTLEQEMRQLAPRWVVDATHPFAVVISERIQRLCSTLDQPHVQIERRQPAMAAPGEQLELLDGVGDLRQRSMVGEHLLLAIGARELSAAMAATAECSHYARVLDQPSSLQAALAAGLPQGHIACLRPDPRGVGELEQALCRRWSITRVLCRQGGGRSEAIWRQVCRQLGLPLLLLRRPEGRPGLPMAVLLEKLGQP
jgi:precorrin-6A/cobalt-precorrin-6A reductase